MITQNFIGRVEKFHTDVEFRQINEAFDAMIEEANRNFDKEQDIFSESDN